MPSSKHILPLKLSRRNDFKSLQLTSSLVAYYSEEEIWYRGEDSYGSQDCAYREITFEVINFKNGKKFSPCSSHSVRKIYPLTEDYFAVRTEFTLLVLDTRECKVQTTFHFDQIKRNLGFSPPDFRETLISLLDHFFEIIFFEDFVKKEFVNFNQAFVDYFKDITTDDNKIIPAHCELIQDGAYLSIRRHASFYLCNDGGVRGSTIGNCNMTFVWHKLDVVAAYFKEIKTLTFWEYKNYQVNFEVIVKKIPGVVEVANKLLDDGRLVYCTDTAVEILNVADFTTEHLCSINRPISNLEVMCDGSITFLTPSVPDDNSDANFKMTVYQFEKPLRCIHTEIYEAAKVAENNLNLAKLKLQKILSGRHINIDIFDHKGMTPAARLAKEGNEKAAVLLKNYGANINHIARGAAMGGRRNLAGSELQWFPDVNINYIAFGAAFAGNLVYAEELRIHHRADINHLAMGAASGGNSNREYSELLRTKFKANVNLIAMHAARAGNDNYAEFLRKEQSAEISFIARGAAMYVDKTYAEYLRVEHGASPNHLAEGAARVRHYKYAEFLHHEHGALLKCIAYGAAYAGDREYVNALCLSNTDVIFKFIYLMLAMGGHQKYIQHSLDHAEKSFMLAPQRLISYTFYISSLMLKGIGIGGHTHLSGLFTYETRDRMRDRLNEAYAEGGHSQYIANIREGTGYGTLKSLADVAARGGHFHYVVSLPDIEMKWIYSRALRSGHWYYVKNAGAHESIINFYKEHMPHAQGVNAPETSISIENLYINSFLISNVLKDVLANSRLALHAMSFFPIDDGRKYQHWFTGQPGYFWKALEKAKQFKLLRPIYNYNQCLGLGNVALIFLFTKFSSNDTTWITTVATFLAPLNFKEADDMRNKVKATYHAKFSNAFFKNAGNPTLKTRIHLESNIESELIPAMTRRLG